MNKKTIVTALCAVLLILSVLLSACGGEPGSTPAETGAASGEPAEKVVRDIREIASALCGECSFSETLSANDSYLVKKVPQLDGKYTDCAAYVPAGITPEEIFVYKANSADDAKTIASALEAYVSQQIDDYSDYAAAQVPKLKDYVLCTADDIVVYVVSCDNSSALKAAEAQLP